MNWQEKLNTLTLQVQGDTDYHQMLHALIHELQAKTQVNMEIKEDKRILSQWEDFLESFESIVTEWGNSDSVWIKKKKLYEEMEDLMAEIDDWIDELNETVLADDQQLGYIENWDIGIFFE